MRVVPILLLAAIWFLTPTAHAEDRKSRPPEGDYLKVEVRGTLTVPDKVEKVKPEPSASTASSGGYAGASITAGETSVFLYLDKDLLKAARKLNGKKAVLTGNLLFIYPPAGTERLSTVRPLHPQSVIQVTAIKAVEAK
jgi:hypothetical protein